MMSMNQAGGDIHLNCIIDILYHLKHGKQIWTKAVVHF